jgi:hypothetical protein
MSGHRFISFFVLGLRFTRFFRARGCAGVRIAKYKLDAVQNHLCHLRSELAYDYRIQQNKAYPPTVAGEEGAEGTPATLKAITV